MANRKDYYRRWYEKNRAQLREKRKQYRRTHAEALNARGRAKYAADRAAGINPYERYKEYQFNYRLQRREQKRQYASNYYYANREAILAKRRAK